ncbi:MAG: Daunorubicin/doxorubicin resistance ATP-binding protein DrrA [Firmicutes bacterium ADurb.Bin506]|jgi:ABC-2 type transport system ATP-binding protein|nr:MAG: Daunorubicin/doxorubicin resistance ATP-binding protein DrrA [Firmicutes bacterium ADurb.Bin506]
MIAVSAYELRKVYRVAVRQPGLLGSLRQVIAARTRDITAVDGVSFDIEQGEFVGYIGPNGAGKSTTVKMLAGILHPTSGQVLVNGVSPVREREAVARRIGVVFGQRTQLWWDLPTVDSFEILAALYDVSAADYRRAMRELTDLLELGEFLDVPVRRLSLGQRMRADLAAALLHSPGVLFLDEPTIGLDVMAKAQVRDFLTRVNRERGVTILLTTHDMRDIEELCRRVMVINHGRLMFDGDLESLVASAGLRTIVRLQLAGAPPARLAVGQQLGDGAVVVAAVDQSSRQVDLAFDRRSTSAAQALVAAQQLGEVRDVSLIEAGIEETVKRLLEQ